MTADFKLVLTAGRYQAAAATALNGKNKGAISEGMKPGLLGQSLTIFIVEILFLHVVVQTRVCFAGHLPVQVLGSCQYPGFGVNVTQYRIFFSLCSR